MYGVIVGKIGRIETKFVGESFLLNLSVAEKYYDTKSKERKTTWYGVSFWGKRAEGITEFLHTGMDISVFGQSFMEEYNGKKYLKIIAQDIIMQGRSGADNNGQTQGKTNSQTQHTQGRQTNQRHDERKEYTGYQEEYPDPLFEDDIPF